MKLNNQKEAIFHYAWQTKKFDILNLETTSKESLKILKFGLHNSNAGPDFMQAEVIIGNQKWIGNIEIHNRSSDWYNHRHHQDANYDSVILHVSYIHDKEVYNSKQQYIPVLELKDILDSDLLERYRVFQKSNQFIPCEQLIRDIDNGHIEMFKEQLVVERLMLRSEILERMMVETEQNWTEVAYRYLFRNVGGNLNKEAYETLARISTHKLVMKHVHDAQLIYAILFGQAGLIPEEGDSFCSSLNEHYQFLVHKYSLRPMKLESWNFARMRPSNFPTQRIAYLSEILIHTPRIMNLYLDISDLEKLKTKLTRHLYKYWDDHYVFNKVSKKVNQKKASEAFVERLIINAIIPFRFYYGHKNQNANLKLSSIDLLRQLKSEKNKISMEWGRLGIKMESAFDSQALLQLYKNNCNLGNCLKCKIGHLILSK